MAPVLLASLGLAGCTAVSGFPRPVLTTAQEDAEVALYAGPAAMERYDACADKMACRNTIIDARVRGVDLAFTRFERQIYRQENRVSLGSDLAATALDSIATLTGTKALAGAAGLLTGSRDAYHKQVLATSLPLLFDQMIANRREALVRIRQGQRLPVSAYTLFQALQDVSDYEEAGSLPAAAAALSASAGARSRTAEAQLDALRNSLIAANAPVPQPVLAPPSVSAAPATPIPVAPQPTVTVVRPASGVAPSPAPMPTPVQPKPPTGT